MNDIGLEFAHDLAQAAVDAPVKTLALGQMPDTNSCELRFEPISRCIVKRYQSRDESIAVEIPGQGHDHVFRAGAFEGREDFEDADHGLAQPGVTISSRRPHTIGHLYQLVPRQFGEHWQG